MRSIHLKFIMLAEKRFRGMKWCYTMLRGCRCLSCKEAFFPRVNKIASQNYTETPFYSVISRRLLHCTWAVLFITGHCTVSISYLFLGPLVQLCHCASSLNHFQTNDVLLWRTPTQMFGALFHEVGYGDEVKR